MTERTVEQEARRLLAWHAHGGIVRQVHDIILRSMDANEEPAKCVHLIPIGEAIGVAITEGRADPDDNEIVFISSHALAAAFSALGFRTAPAMGAAIVPPVFAVPDYKPED